MAKLKNIINLILRIWIFISLVMCAYMIVMIIKDFAKEKYLTEIIDRTHKHPGELYIDDRVDPFVDEFIEDAKRYGFDYGQIYVYLDEIILEKTSWEGKHGICSFYVCEYGHIHGRIRVSEELFYKDEFGFKSVLYHELGHWFGKEHTYCSQELIMHYAYDSGASDSLEAVWTNSKEIFFNFDQYKKQLDACSCFERSEPEQSELDDLKQRMKNLERKKKLYKYLLLPF